MSLILEWNLEGRGLSVVAEVFCIWTKTRTPCHILQCKIPKMALKLMKQMKISIFLLHDPMPILITKTVSWEINCSIAHMGIRFAFYN